VQNTQSCGHSLLILCSQFWSLLLKSPLLLLVEDNVHIREMLAEMARAEGYRTAEAGNGREALTALSVDWPSLIILDLEMPVMSGWGFLRELRARGVLIPVIIMSGRTDQASECVEMGASSFVGKPIDFAALLDKIARHQRQTAPPIDFRLA
jgi:DNA-binding response OmpR family regulator